MFLSRTAHNKDYPEYQVNIFEKKNLLNTIPWQNVEIIWSANCSAWQTRDTEVILRGLNASMVPMVSSP